VSDPLKKKKKKHRPYPDYVGKTVEWQTVQSGPCGAKTFTGKVIAQSLLLVVKLPDGRVRCCYADQAKVL
jgi:hypothetical protein